MLQTLITRLLRLISKDWHEADHISSASARYGLPNAVFCGLFHVDRWLIPGAVPLTGDLQFTSRSA